MKKRIAVVATVLALGAAGYAVAQDDDSTTCTVSAEKQAQLERQGWTAEASDENGRTVVCE